MVDVERLVGDGVGVCGGDEEGYGAEVEGPAAGCPVDLDIVVVIVVVGAWGNLDKFGGVFGLSLFVHPEAKFGAVEVFAVKGAVDGRFSGYVVFCLWCRKAISVGREASVPIGVCRRRG